MSDLDKISQRYSVLPSTILNGSIIDLQFDMLVAQVGFEDDVKTAKESQKRMQRRRR